MENLMNFIMKELYRNIQMLIRLGVVLGFIGLKGRHLTRPKNEKEACISKYITNLCLTLK